MSGAAGNEHYIARFHLMGLVVDHDGTATGENIVKLFQPCVTVRVTACARTDKEKARRILLGPTAFVRDHNAIPHGAIWGFNQGYIARLKDDFRFGWHSSVSLPLSLRCPEERRTHSVRSYRERSRRLPMPSGISLVYSRHIPTQSR